MLYIRLLVATAGAFGSTLLVAIYSYGAVRIFEHLAAKIRRFESQHELLEWLPLPTQILVQYRWFALLIPACLLTFGICVIHRWKNRAAFELVVTCQWLFALLWLAFCLLGWLAPYIPNNVASQGHVLTFNN